MMVGLIIFFVMQMYLVKNCISDIMANMLASSSVDLDSSPGLVKSNTLKLVFVTSPLSMQYYGVRTKTGWLVNQNNVSEWSDMSTQVVSVS
jgi:hypothetical protein